MKKYSDIQTLFKNKFLNFYHMDAITDSGRNFDYYFVSRNPENEIKAKTNKNKAEGIVIYPILKDDPEKIILIKQFRYPINDYLYELPAGLIDKRGDKNIDKIDGEYESANEAAIRELKEETGFDFEVYEGGNSFYRRPFYMGAGYTDEASIAVFGYASGDINNQKLEDTESIQVVIADKAKAKEILETGKVSLRCGYLLMNFINSDKNNPFQFLG